MLIDHISIIFEEDNKERLLSIATYFFAIVERSPKKIQEAVENLEFTTKSKIMSTLTLLREEGKEIGIEKGIYKKEMIAIRNMTIKQLDVGTIAEFLAITNEHVETIQKDLLMETQILALFSKKHSVAKIAKKLKVSEWMVEVIGELKKNEDKK